MYKLVLVVGMCIYIYKNEYMFIGVSDDTRDNGIFSTISFECSLVLFAFFHFAVIFTKPQLYSLYKFKLSLS